jgi:hypothetical protein
VNPGRAPQLKAIVGPLRISEELPVQIIRAITVAGLLGATTLAQGFPWEIFKPRTLKEVISITTKAVRPDDSMFLANNQLESKVEVVFTGQSRPIIKARKTFITMWVGMLRANQKDYGELYEREYLYKEGSDEFWLATSTPITKYFDKELKPGDKMQLYLISIGAYQGKEGIDCVLLVEEFQKSAAQQPLAADSVERGAY